MKVCEGCLRPRFSAAAMDDLKAIANNKKLRRLGFPRIDENLWQMSLMCTSMTASDFTPAKMVFDNVYRFDCGHLCLYCKREAGQMVAILRILYENTPAPRIIDYL